MAQAFELTIEISADGRTVKGTVGGVAGKTCENVAALLDQVGREVEHAHTPDYHRPEPVEIAPHTQRHQGVGGGF
jgi:hypothetical protein